MNKVIYCKYSNERARKFQIKTEIIDKYGCKTIKKVATNSDAIFHLKKIIDNYHTLNTINKCSDWKINKCNGFIDNSSIEFEFLIGITLEEFLNGLIINKKLKEFKNILKQYINNLISFSETEKFYLTEEFIEVFGDKVIYKPMLSCKISNIDMIFSNIILNEKWNITDYEWVFKFPVPINYIIYRSIFYFYKKQYKDIISKEEMFEIAGITTEEQKIYFEYEMNFQKYVSDNFYTTHSFFSDINMEKRNYNIKELSDSKRLYEFKLYLDNNGYSERDSIKRIIDSKEFSFKVNFDNKYSKKEIRLDPTSTNCIIGNIDIYTIINGNKIYIPIKSTNCDLYVEEKYFFETNDPQIYLNTDSLDLECLFINFSFVDYDNSDIKSIISILKNKDNELKNKDNELKVLRAYINEIHNSKGWTVLQKFKKIIKK